MSFYNFNASFPLSVCLLLSARTYCFPAWQSLGLTKEWKAVEGGIVWALLARLTVNHVYEDAEGHSEDHVFASFSLERPIH